MKTLPISKYPQISYWLVRDRVRVRVRVRVRIREG
jgi:hypothetical protein